MVNKYTKKYKKIINELIEKSFVELKGKRIVVLGFVPFGTFVAMFSDIFFVSFIFISPKRLKKFTKFQQEGIFVHELCHMERHKKRNFFERIIYIFKYLLSKKVRIREENETDKLTIKKGYARELYDFTLNLDKTYARNKDYLKQVYDRGYLSSKQIKSYAKKIGKW